MFKHRLAALQNKIPTAQAVLATNKYTISYLTGFGGGSAALLVTHKHSFFVTDSRYFSEAKKIVSPFIRKILLKESLHETLRYLAGQERINELLFEENDLRYSAFASLKKNLKRIKLAPQNGLIENLRSCKDAGEIKLLQKAQSITDRAFIELKKSLRAGQTEKAIAWTLEKICRELGANGLSFPPIIAINRNSSVPHHSCSQTRLKKGDMVLVDMGVRYKGYCSDMTRMIFTGNPAPAIAQTYGIVLAAQKKAIGEIRPGMSGNDADGIARDFLKKSRLNKKFLHSLGHGVGLQIHEFPGAGPKSSQIISAGNVITVEPGVYLDGRYGIRIEDMILVGKTGNRILTRTPKSLESSIHKLL